MGNSSTARLLITCPDRRGIIAAVTTFLHDHGANITALDQHTSCAEGGTFFMRLEFQAGDLACSLSDLERAFKNSVAEPFEMHSHLRRAVDHPTMAVLVSKADHALMEVLWRWRRGEIPAQLTCVVSNHEDLREAVREFGVPFHHVPVTPETKPEAEARILELVGDPGLLVLARYMQVLSPGFVARFPARIINIHHSFLPAFAGARPYGQAYQRGVKLVGATAHYVTNDLDEGPIIEQDVARVSHRQTVPELVRLGRDIERQVLARALRWHLEDRVIVDGRKTVVFA